MTAGQVALPYAPTLVTTLAISARLRRSRAYVDRREHYGEEWDSQPLLGAYLLLGETGWSETSVRLAIPCGTGLH